MKHVRKLVALVIALVGTAPLSSAQVLQRGFSSVELGMSLQEAKSALLGDPNFRYRGDPDVQFLPITELPLIETEGRAFVSRGVFQFHGGVLSVISLMLDRTRLDYFTVYRGLVERYGEPTRLDPGQAVWEDDLTRIALERPLTVKYIDVPTLTAIIESGRMEEALDEVTRQQFLDQL